MHTQNEINNTVTHDNIKKAHVKSAIPINKVHIENNTASNTSKKTHKLFNKVLKQIKTFNKIPKQDIIFNYHLNVKNYIKNYLIKCLLSYYILKVQDIKTHLQMLIKHMLMMLNMLKVSYIIT